MYNFNDLLTHFDSQPEIREKIEANALLRWNIKEIQAYDDTSLSELLSALFRWSETPEGFDYWLKINDELAETPVNIEERDGN